MDGGAKQDEMANRLKREVKKSRRDRDLGHRHAIVEPTTDGNQKRFEQFAISETQRDSNDSQEPRSETANTPLQREHDCKLASKHFSGNMNFARSDTILLTFHLEYILPFLFPFYNPSMLEGGRSWILEMMISSPVVRQATLCQSSYFFSLARGVPSDDLTWETVLAQTRDAFSMLRQSLQFIHGSSITEHLHGAVRILSSIMQIQRFEVAVLSFENCQPHLNAALALFRQLLDSCETVEPTGNRSKFSSVISLLGPATRLLPSQSVYVPSAEQAAFRFSSALLLYDDIIASTVSQQQPKLYEYHQCLLNSSDGTEPIINFETVMGCQNWVLLHISETATLDMWKQGCQSAGNLSMLDLVHRATPIKDSLERQLTQLEEDMVDPDSRQPSSLLERFTTGDSHPKTSSAQTALVTQIWAHATLLYLSVVVTGWQPASIDARYHVDKIIELLTFRISPPALLRAIVWPFCVAGCLAEPVRIPHFRAIADALQPSSIFGTVRKALEIMEDVWRNQDAADNLSRDLATCFRNQGDLVLLV
ncbi:uncharacterized protein BHQ10_009433 [Talaromyces amestolkiae]|uniref:Fungal-specific transcription factor domain-containing protein n=1 Tax=Talaromyces amestolkiae TaxID=1196081 RepID=A0A364LCG5_TALAM|nr:uncharacterized protein BHQ10_009433 [Talaromyces amestolkiae]RAO73421.1 hypothetical protein BHQ10_009433 [Talaromyces amestolkiae]